MSTKVKKWLGYLSGLVVGAIVLGIGFSMKPKQEPGHASIIYTDQSVGLILIVKGIGILIVAVFLVMTILDLINKEKS